MARRKRNHQPMDPAEIARRAAESRRNPASWGPNEEALKLASNANITDQAETRNKVRRVQRFDVFHLFHARGELEQHALQAVRRLQEDIAILHRTQGSSGSTVVRLDQAAQDASDFAKARIKAGAKIRAAFDKTGSLSVSLLQALCEHPAITGSEVNNWRSIVHKITGEHNHMAQSALVKAAAYNLSGAYQTIDQGVRKAG